MSHVVIDGISCPVTLDQLKQFDAEATKLGTTREEAAARHLTDAVKKGKEEKRRRALIRRNASDTQAHKEQLERLRKSAEARGFDWKRNHAFICTARANAVAELEDLANLFAVSGNGRCAWRAFRVAAEHQLRIPGWVSAYLYESATKLDEIQWGKNAAVKIATKLKLHTPGGRSSAAARFTHQRIRFYVASYMDSLIQRDHRDYAAAAEAAVEEASHYLPRPVAVETVKKWHRKFKNAIGRYTDEMKSYRAQVLDRWPVHPNLYSIERPPPEYRKPID